MKLPERFPDGFVLPGAGIAVIKTVVSATAQRGHRYLVKFPCCGATDTTSHLALKKRASSSGMCRRCLDAKNSREMTGVAVADRKVKKPKPLEDFLGTFVDWPAPASIKASGRRYHYRSRQLEGSR